MVVINGRGCSHGGCVDNLSPDSCRVAMRIVTFVINTHAVADYKVTNKKEMRDTHILPSYNKPAPNSNKASTASALLYHAA